MKLPVARYGPRGAEARVALRRRYPAGKAFARIHYFETQRGLSITRYEASRVRGTAAPALVQSKLRGARARSRRTGGPDYAGAFAAKQRLRPPFAGAAGQPVWRELGPHLIPHGQTYGKGGRNRPAVAGRCIGLVVNPSDPRHLTLCTAGGGIWSSADDGASWRPLTDSCATLAMGAIAAAPSSPNLVYAGTGEGDSRSPQGVGLLRSSDGGRRWASLDVPALHGVGVYDIAVDPRDPYHLFVATTAGLFESRDGGATVRRKFRGLVWDVSIHPQDSPEVFAGCEHGLLRSVDRGATWARVDLPELALNAPLERMEVRHAPSNPGIVYVAAADPSTAFLWRRGARGGKFTRESAPPKLDVSQAWYDWCLAVPPDDPHALYWGAIELYRGRRDAGRWDWTGISSRSAGDSIHPDQHHLTFDPSNPATLYACNDGGLFRSRDRGTHWESLNPGLGITEFEFLAHMESDDTWILGGTQDNGTLAYRDGSTWDQRAVGDGGDCAAVDAPAPWCFHGYFEMWLERAAAKGPSAFRWKDVTPPFPDDYQCLFYPPLDVRGRLVAKAGATVFVSDDAGDTWEEVPLPPGDSSESEVVSALTIVGERALVVGTNQGRLFRIRRSRGGWVTSSVEALSSPRRAFVSDIVVLGPGMRTFWVSCSAFGGGHVFRSQNAGRSWSDRTGNLPDIPVNAIVVDPADPKVIYAATDHGVYRSTDSGSRWTPFGSGLPNAVVGDLILHERRRVLRAGTRNRGVWEVDV